MCGKLTSLIAEDDDFSHLRQPGQTLVVQALPQGYSHSYKQRTGKITKDFQTWGHPKGALDSLPKFFKHWKELILRNTVYGCPCVLCNPVPTRRGAASATSTPGAPIPMPAAPATTTQAASIQQPVPRVRAAPARKLTAHPSGVKTMLASAYSDGTGFGCSHDGAVRRNNDFLGTIGQALATKAGLHGTYRLEKLPYGFSIWQHQREKGRWDTFYCGHPKNSPMMSIPEFADHINWLQNISNGDVDVCPCSKCSGNKRNRGEAGVRGDAAEYIIQAANPQSDAMQQSPQLLLGNVPMGGMRPKPAPSPTTSAPPPMPSAPVPLGSVPDESPYEERYDYFAGESAVFPPRTPPHIGTRGNHLDMEYETWVYDQINPFVHPEQYAAGQDAIVMSEAMTNLNDDLLMGCKGCGEYHPMGLQCDQGNK